MMAPTSRGSLWAAAASLRTSSTVVTPPEAMTGKPSRARARQIPDRCRVDALHHSVVGDVGVDHRGDLETHVLPGQLERRRLRDVEPAFGRYHRIAGVDPERDPSREF